MSDKSRAINKVAEGLVNDIPTDDWMNKLAEGKQPQRQCNIDDENCDSCGA